MSASRTASVNRKTKETAISLALDLDGAGASEIATGIGFLDHMLTLLSRHSLIDLKIQCKGDTEVDYHHTVEDVGLALGTALDQALGERRGIRRYGFFLLPMDESLAQVALDLGGRPFLAYANGVNSSFVRDFDTNLFEEFFRALCVNARMNLHVRVDGNEAHHAIEGVFKGFARALREAIEADPRDAGIPSSKGVL
ncbi:MAG: imidazoleglycerol-phosphate dehydratase HisB [Kiritimatiellae bacterium]|jgi:imidazoleglycerol-phosphate dehydratase|nr:imidazoleglycerol-phosphate dehydratase HisB [Kiritimatiellia bacterium]NLE42002.1 imidazoleglycerol-phosphate dehydratase HisB [Lentisphaerota bacterium]